MKIHNILAFGLISLASAAPQAQDNGTYTVPCVKINDECAKDTEDLTVFTYTNLKATHDIIDQLKSTNEKNDIGGSLLLYTAASAGLWRDNLFKPNTSDTDSARELLTSNNITDIDCNHYQDNLQKLCNAVEKTIIKPQSEDEATQSTLTTASSASLKASYEIVCSKSHGPVGNACISLVNRIKDDNTQISGGPRNIREDFAGNTCYVSWSKDADFPTKYLYNAANSLLQACISQTYSGKAMNTHLGSVTVTECMSDRPNGCS